jgi:hypothetical protein
MVERVAVLLGTVQFRLAIRIIVPENATIDDAEKAAWATIGNYPLNDFVEVALQRVETSVPDDQQPEILWERED